MRVYQFRHPDEINSHIKFSMCRNWIFCIRLAELTFGLNYSIKQVTTGNLLAESYPDEINSHIKFSMCRNWITSSKRLIKTSVFNSTAPPQIVCKTLRCGRPCLAELTFGLNCSFKQVTYIMLNRLSTPSTILI